MRNASKMRFKCGTTAGCTNFMTSSQRPPLKHVNLKVVDCSVVESPPNYRPTLQLRIITVIGGGEVLSSGRASSVSREVLNPLEPFFSRVDVLSVCLAGRPNGLRCAPACGGNGSSRNVSCSKPSLHCRKRP